MLQKRVFDSGTFNYLKIVQTLVRGKLLQNSQPPQKPIQVMLKTLNYFQKSFQDGSSGTTSKIDLVGNSIL